MSITRKLQADFNVAVTGVGYQLYGDGATVGSRVSSGITNPYANHYVAAGVDVTGASSVRWDGTSGGTTLYATETFDLVTNNGNPVIDTTANLPANVVQIAGQAANAAGAVAFPSSIGTSTYAGADTTGTGTLLTRLTGTRAGLLDNLDAAMSSRMATFAVPASFSAADFTRLDASVSSRSTFAGGAVASVTAPVTTGTVTDKTGYSATATNLPSDYATATGLTAVNSNVSAVGSVVTGIPAAVWAFATRTLSAFGFSVSVSNLPADYARNNVAPSWWVGPDNADVVAALADLAQLLARTDPTSALAAVKAVTDQFRFTTAHKVDSAADIDTSGITASLSEEQSAQLANVPAIKAKTDTLGSASVTVTSPVATATGQITLNVGDDYLARDGRAVVLNLTGGPDLTGASVALLIWGKSTPGTVNGSTLTIELPRTYTAALAVYMRAATQTTVPYFVRATLANGDLVTLAQGNAALHAASMTPS